MTRLSGVCVALLLSGCPLSDKYFIESTVQPDGVSGAAGWTAAGSNAGSAAGAVGSVAAAGTGAAGAPCVSHPERCNGHDDNCDTYVDEGACPTDCSAFISDGHGYMFCTNTSMANAPNAQQGCILQGLRLAWIESADESNALQQLSTLPLASVEFYFGATDAQLEGEWRWMDGDIFWLGGVAGSAVNGAYSNWNPVDPNGLGSDGLGMANCAVVATDGSWRDRPCTDVNAYLCEEP